VPCIDHLPKLSDDDRAAILAPLDSFSRNRGYTWQPSPLVLVLRTDDGSIVGGLIGETLWGWLRIDILAVAEEFWVSGWGRKIIEEAERTAIAAGCHSAWVDTFSFQSRGSTCGWGIACSGNCPITRPARHAIS